MQQNLIRSDSRQKKRKRLYISRSLQWYLTNSSVAPPEAGSKLQLQLVPFSANTFAHFSHDQMIFPDRDAHCSGVAEYNSQLYRAYKNCTYYWACNQLFLCCWLIGKEHYDWIWDGKLRVEEGNQLGKSCTIENSLKEQRKTTIVAT